MSDYPGTAGGRTMKRAHELAKETRKAGESYPDVMKRAWGRLKEKGQADFPGAHGVAHIQDAHKLARSIRRDGESYKDALRRAWKQLKTGEAESEMGSPQKSTETSRPAARKATTSRQKARSRVTKPEGRTPGYPTVATGPDPTKEYSFDIRVVELDDLIPSHTDALGPNPKYPAELQPRIRDRAASRLQIDGIAANLKPEALLTDSGTLDRGMPIVGPDLVVESGNGRILALRKARADYPGVFKTYRGMLRTTIKEKYPDLADAAPELALPGNDTSPVLVRVRTVEVDRVEFAGIANEATTLSMSPLEQALQDANRISDEALANVAIGESQTVDQALRSPANQPLVAHFIGGLAANERAALVGAAGELNLVGLQRLKSAIFAKVYPGEAGHRLTKAFVESIDPILKNMESAMFEALPATARAEGMIRSGARTADLSLGEDMAKAVDMLARLKATGPVAEDFIRQTSAFGRELTPEQERLLVFLEVNGRSRKVLREFLKDYAEAVVGAPHPDQGAMFPGAQETKDQLLARLIEDHTKRAVTGGLFELIKARQTAGLADPLRPGGPHWNKCGGDVVFAVVTRRPREFRTALNLEDCHADSGARPGVVITNAAKKRINRVARALGATIEIEEPTPDDMAAAGFQAELIPGQVQRVDLPDPPPDPEQATLFDPGKEQIKVGFHHLFEEVAA